MGKTSGLLRLETLLTVYGFIYLPITTEQMRIAAQCWAISRQHGRPASDEKSLDGDVILAAQARSLAENVVQVITATSNAAHVQAFVPASHWQDIHP
jgi:hypothetical protein